MVPCWPELLFVSGQSTRQRGREIIISSIHADMSPLQRLTVMISSTILDLPEYRKQVQEACERLGMFPLMMEHLPASDDDAIAKSTQLVDQADVYVGVYAHRYGHIPVGHDISITEMEYNHAVDCRIPRLIFVMHKDQPVLPAFVEKGEKHTKLEAFKQRVEQANFVCWFTSPADLRANVIHGLSEHRQARTHELHNTSAIPIPAEPYIAHPYVLLQTHKLIGRERELNLLTDWALNQETRILSIIAIGGAGKSALAWRWFNEVAPQKIEHLAGRVWWSFYESNARFENFISRTLAYVTRRTEEEVSKISQHDSEDQLLASLDREPFLLVLDGLERILLAYASVDAMHLSDDDLDERTANRLDGGQHRLRKTTDPHVGSFLRKLLQVRCSRVLASSRLYPADLQTSVGHPLPGSAVYFLGGLSDDDSLKLWTAFNKTGSREELLRLFHRCENHPLLIQALATEVARFRRAPGDFDQWRNANRNFDPFELSLVQVKSHVLTFSLTGLNHRESSILQIISAFRMPVGYDSLSSLVSDGESRWNELDLDAALTDLEDRGLVGWDRRANRYDLHPLVCGIVWKRMDYNTRQNICLLLKRYLEAVPTVSEEQVQSLDDLAPTIELYHTLVAMESFDEAVSIYRHRLDQPMHYRLSTCRERAEMLERLFVDGLEGPPRVSATRDQVWVLNALGVAYALGGQPARAIPLYERCLRMDRRGLFNRDAGLFNLPKLQRLCGDLRQAEANARLLLLDVRQTDHSTLRECYALDWLGVALAARGAVGLSYAALSRSHRMASSVRSYTACDSLAVRALWLGENQEAKEWADQAVLYCREHHLQRVLIRAIGLQGVASMLLKDLESGEQHLQEALAMARAGNEIGEELPLIIAFAELLRRRNQLCAARESLEDFWDPAKRGPYVLLQADAFNVLARIERDALQRDAAVNAATSAYQLAWCQGPPFAYQWGLNAAREHLLELGAAVPTLPPYDDLAWEPMPAIEIDPPD